MQRAQPAKAGRGGIHDGAVCRDRTLNRAPKWAHWGKEAGQFAKGRPSACELIHQSLNYPQRFTDRKKGAAIKGSPLLPSVHSRADVTGATNVGISPVASKFRNLRPKRPERGDTPPLRCWA